eukprot:m.196924 g.196924  ORF g.196924 m.196924 type:complete len:187 (-) comp25076_c0_seq1:1064-1624(-)
MDNTVLLSRVMRPITLIKFALSFLAMIAFSVTVDYSTDCGPYHFTWKSINHSEYFVTVFVLLFLIEGALFLISVFAMDSLMQLQTNWWLIELIYSAFWAFMMLLSCCLFSDGITYVHNFYENEQNVKGCPYTGWKFGVAVGFIAFFVMLGKCYLTYKELRDSGMSSDGSYTPLDDDGEPGEVTVSV